MKSVNACICAFVIGAPRPEQPVERDDELVERRVLVERAAADVVAARAVAAPVHRAVVRHAAEALASPSGP
jgi:hypothetical protein